MLLEMAVHASRLTSIKQDFATEALQLKAERSI
jgi:hypothetical protein